MKRPSAASRLIIILSNVFSSVFAPLFIPAYCMWIALTVTPLATLPLATRVQVEAVVAVFTAVIPLSVLYIMKKTGKITDIDVSDRGQRAAPVAMMVVCYVLTLIYLTFVHAPMWLLAYFASGIFTAILFGLITILGRWKISMHGAGVGSAIGFILALWVCRLANHQLMWLLTTALLIAGCVGTSRVILNRHTLAQVFVGSALSLFITYLTVIYL